MKTSVVLPALLLLGIPLCAKATETPKGRFAAVAQWAPHAAQPLDLGRPGLGAGPALDRLIGDAHMIVLGEGLHGSAEPLEVRNALFRYLVEHLGFTAIALESGMVEGFDVDAYVHGGDGTAAAVAAHGITFGLGGFPQQAELIGWMRAYNQDPAHKAKLSFYGMDVSVPGSATEPLALDMALAYLQTVAPDRATAFRSRVAPYRDYLNVDRRNSNGKDYTGLPATARDAVTAVIADLMAELGTHEDVYVAASGAAAFNRAIRLVVAAQQADAYLRQFSVGWTPAQGPVLQSVAVADRSKSDNVDWIRSRHPRVLVFSHFGHAAHSGVSIALPGGPPMALPPMVGTYLYRHYGKDVIVIGQLIGNDHATCGPLRPPAGADTLEGTLAAAVKPDLWLLDLRPAPAAVRASLTPPHDLYGQQPTHSLSIAYGAEAILFTRTVTSATPCPVAPDH